jgi:glycosyltransferase involved in cell wall biosynthesis
MPTLSAILITKNESLNLEDCLASLQGLVDEIVIVDTNSQDNTLEIAKRYGAIISQPADWPGFGPQKNRALALATKEWVLSIDADERLTPELIKEIKAVLSQPGDVSCFSIPRSSYYCGRFMKHSGWYPDYVDRLFKRESAIFSNHLVHERLLPSGKVGKLTQPFLHYSYRNFEQVLAKVNSYSSAGAQQAFEAGKSATLGSAIGHGIWAFVRTYIVRRGFLDGSHGFALAISNGQTSYYKYLKLWHLCKSSRTK